MSSRIVPDNRAGQVGTTEAKQPKMRLSTLPFSFFTYWESRAVFWPQGHIYHITMHILNSMYLLLRN